jgi:hypothetical protein
VTPLRKIQAASSKAYDPAALLVTALVHEVKPRNHLELTALFVYNYSFPLHPCQALFTKTLPWHSCSWLSASERELEINVCCCDAIETLRLFVPVGKNENYPSVIGEW